MNRLDILFNNFGYLGLCHWLLRYEPRPLQAYYEKVLVVFLVGFGSLHEPI